MLLHFRISHRRSVPLLCPSISDVLATPLSFGHPRLSNQCPRSDEEDDESSLRSHAQTPEVAPSPRSHLLLQTQTVDQLFRSSWKKAGIPDSAHSDVSQEQDLSTDPEDPPKHELVDMEPDLTVSENVGFEMRDDVPGLAFSRDGSQGWTPVVHRKKRRQIRKTTPTRSTKAEWSEEELESCVRKAKQVEYQIRDGMPGLKMRFGPTNWNVKWTPVISSPVSSRTRSQTLK